jgi:hypothetical protein
MNTLTAALVLLPLAAPADPPTPAPHAPAAVAVDARAAGRQVLARHADAVITVRLVLKRRMVYQGREQGSSDVEMEISGTVLTPSGLTVVSDTASNPSGSSLGGGGDTRIDTDTTDVKLVLADGREVPARFVLRDTDLDLAFLQPEEKGLSLPAVDLAHGAASVPQALDPLLFLYRLGKTLGRQPAVAVADVRTVVPRPRTFLVSDMVTGLMALGCPAFDGAGRPVGIVVMRRSPAPTTPPSGVREMLELMTPVVITAPDVLDLVTQAQKAPR